MKALMVLFAILGVGVIGYFAVLGWRTFVNYRRSLEDELTYRAGLDEAQRLLDRERDNPVAAPADPAASNNRQEARLK